VIVKIDKTNKQLISNFCDIAGSSLETFRYFESRDIDVVDRHIATYVLMSGNNTVGYGHLDLENSVTWLGVCVAEDYLRQGYGKEMMRILISHAIENDIREISLSVDKFNISAKTLYNKLGFIIYHDNEKSHFMKLKLTEAASNVVTGTTSAKS